MSKAYDESTIQTMDSLSYIRHRMGLFLDSKDVAADTQILKELIDNSCDESLDPKKTYDIKIVIFTKDNKTYQAAVIDHGRGVPLRSLKDVYTSTQTSGKFHYDYGGATTGSYGLGSKVTVALSTHFLAYSKRADGFAYLKVKDRQIIDNKVLASPDKNESTIGTTAFYCPDPSGLPETKNFMTDPRGFAKTIDTLNFMSAIKPNTIFTVYKVNTLLDQTFFDKPALEQWKYFRDVKGELVYQSPAGFSVDQYVRDRFGITCQKPEWSLHLQNSVRKEAQTLDYDIHLYVSDGKRKQVGLLGSVNSVLIQTGESYHFSVLRDILRKRIVDYLDETDTELVTYFMMTYDFPFYGYVVVNFLGAEYVTQTKAFFKDPAFASLYKHDLNKLIDQSVPDEVWARLYAAIADDLNEKFLQANNRALKLNKGLKNITSDMLNPECYTPCRSKDPTKTEIFITEGNAAGNSVRAIRDPNTQAVFRMRGKPINALTASLADLKVNRVYQDLVRLIGVSPRDTDLSRMNFSRIGLLADADPDGYHIVALLIGTLMKINPLILRSGRVFVINPPLYIISSRGKNIFIRDANALMDIRSSIYQQMLKLKLWLPYKREVKQLNKNEYRDLVYFVKHYNDVLTNTSKHLMVEPDIIERLVDCLPYMEPGKIKTEAIRKHLDLQDVRYNDMLNSLLLVFDGGLEKTVQLDRFRPEVEMNILPMLEKIGWKHYTVIASSVMSGEIEERPVSFAMLGHLFDEIDKAFPITRFKGLGEYSDEQLESTCVNYTTRSAVTIRDLGDVQSIYNHLGVDTTYRKKLVQKQLRDLFSESEPDNGRGDARHA